MNCKIQKIQIQIEQKYKIYKPIKVQKKNDFLSQITNKNNTIMKNITLKSRQTKLDDTIINRKIIITENTIHNIRICHIFRIDLCP